MKLSFVFDQLAGSELAQLSLVGDDGKIKPDKYQKVVDAINLGLIDLYGRFTLKLGKVTVQLDETVEVYKLSDVDKKIGTKLIQIHDVRDQHGHVVPYNDFSRVAIHFTQKTVMHVPKKLIRDHGASEITITYRSMPIQVGNCGEVDDPEFENVDLDYQFVRALCLFVATRMHNPVGLQDATYQPNAFFALYNAECQRLEDENFELSYVAYDDKVQRNGWA